MLKDNPKSCFLCCYYDLFVSLATDDALYPWNILRDSGVEAGKTRSSTADAGGDDAHHDHGVGVLRDHERTTTVCPAGVHTTFFTTSAQLPALDLGPFAL